MSTKKRVEDKISNIPPFGLRMLPELKERVAQAAEEAGRSLNAEIVARLEGSFHKPAPRPVLSELVKSFSENLAMEPGVTEEDLNGLWNAFHQHREAEWKNITSFVEEANEIVRRATGREDPVGQTDFLTEQRRKDRGTE
ncbi:Arc family DNA-binding protein [Agrobacterium tumefaciens]|uniref:Arc family DNA-binding protein n=1 Tax=Agrobacterium tumefaciens TaxID=358 RepID=UPI0015737D52|nr:Arc family DNA-binding protein [Agrobacterium tumefaciens]NTE36669.1 Arc family DNA-binding protein [Agrobacterium tumefaciens]NTE52180.1 Arc family DNA-binding protein [Agrobacterium tumefaciens]